MIADLFKDDGILIEELGPTRTIEAIWTALVVVNPPQEVPMQAWVNQLREVIRSVGSRISADDQKMWDARLSALILKASTELSTSYNRYPRSHLPRRKRTKRGLLDVFGRIGQVLFGLAMDDDVEDLKSVVAQAAAHEQVIIHEFDRMVTVINQTRKFVQENRFDIQDIQRQQKLLEEQFRKYSVHLNELDRKVNGLVIARTIDQTIRELEMVFQEYLLQVSVFKNQKHELERGWLTENTLAIPELNSILEKIKEWGYETPIPEWYYENLHIEPLWNDGSKLVFRVAIPALSQVQYLQYKLHYFPVALDDEHIRTVKGHSNIAVNTESGSVFWPQNCYGVNPKVCVPQKEILTPTCEWGLVTNNSLDLCTLEISKQKGKDADVFPLDLGNFVIVAYHKLPITLRCIGKPPLVNNIIGPTQIELPGHCKLESEQWQISGIKKGISKVIKKFETLSYNRNLNFTWPQEMNLEVAKALKFKERIEVPLLEVKAWSDQFGKIKSPRSKKWYGIIGAIMLVSIVATVISLIKWKPCLRQKSKAETSDNPESKELNSVELATLAV